MRLPESRFAAAILALLAGGILYCLWYGRVGYMPQDSPTVFDGGWRILCGQVPFRDFTMPNAVIPVLMQAAFFKIFGVTWFVYCLHAALLNGVFCLLVYLLMRTFGGSRMTAFWYGLLSGVLFYAPFGVPVQDQHAYFFSTLMLLMTCVAVRSTGIRLRRTFFLLLPSVALTAFLSKQIPTILFLPLVAGIIVTSGRSRMVETFRTLAVGTGLAGVVTLAAWLALGVDADLVRIYFIELPREVGAKRLTWLFGPPSLKTIAYLRGRWPMFLPVVLAPSAAVVLALTAATCWRRKTACATAMVERTRQMCLPLVLSATLPAICLVFVLLTNNSPANGFPLIVAAVGLAHITVLRVFAPAQTCQAGFRSVRILATVAACGCSLLCAWRYDRDINRTRQVHDMHHAATVPEPPRDDALKPLSFLVWDKPRAYSATLEDFAGVVRFFTAHEGNFFLLGDSSILYALTRRISAGPALWFHAGQTLPRRKSRFLPEFEERLLRMLGRYQVRYIVVEATRVNKQQTCTWSGVNLQSLPALEQRVAAHGAIREIHGPFTIIELADPPARGGPE